MCVAGGRRCPGSGTPSAKQRARRKANIAYRRAVAEAVGELTGSEELARRVKDAPLTDVADVVTAAGLDGAAIAKSCGQASYTDKDGHTTTVDVTPAGTTRRTPVTDDTRALLSDVYDETGVYEPGPFAEAVVAGDRAAQEQLRKGVDEHVANRLDLFDEEDLSHLSQERLERRLDQLADLDNYSQKRAGRSLDPETEAKVANLVERYENALNGKDEPDPAPQRDPLADLNNTYGFGEVNKDNVEDVISAANADIENVELDTLTDDEFDEYYSKMDNLDDRVRAVTGDEGIDGFIITAVSELSYRSMDDDDKYDLHPAYRRAAQLDKWAESTMDAGVSEGDSQSARGAYAAAQYLYQYDHPAQQGLGRDERDEYADDAVDWAAQVLDDDEGRGAFERGIAETVVSKRQWDKIKNVQPSTLSDTEFEAHAARFDELTARLDDGKGNALDTGSTQTDLARMAKAIEEDRTRRATPEALRGVRTLYGTDYGEVTEENMDEIVEDANNDIAYTDMSSLTDDDFEEYYNRLTDVDEEVRALGGAGIDNYEYVYEEHEYRSNDADDRYAYYGVHRKAAQVTNWAMETAENTSHVPADAHERGKIQAAKYLQGRSETERFVDTDAVKWAQSVLDDEDDTHGAFEQGIARNVMGKHTLDSLQSADFSTMSEDDRMQAREQINDLRDNLGDYPLLYTDYETERRLGQLYLKLNK